MHAVEAFVYEILIERDLQNFPREFSEAGGPLPWYHAGPPQLLNYQTENSS
jgi:hypothetical protein